VPLVGGFEVTFLSGFGGFVSTQWAARPLRQRWASNSSGKHMNTKSILLGALLGLYGATTFAGPYTDQLSSCLADNTSGKDRKQLAKWMFVAMATHPEMRALANLTQETKDETSRSVGVLVTRLLSEACAVQTRSAVQKEGGSALQGSFSVLGQLAMQELLTNQDVNGSVASFEKYVDRAKVQSALTQK